MEQKQKKIERLLAPDGGINTWINCPYRRERILSYATVVSGSDYLSRLCPFRCPSSPRNADYSICEHIDNPEFDRTRGCSIGGATPIPVYSRFCEAAVVDHICPLKFVR
jgi:hypothetical protein